MQLLCSLPGSSSVGEEGVMRVQLAEQAREILGKSDLVIITERVDDVALLIGQMVKMGEVYAWPQDLMRCDATAHRGGSRGRRRGAVAVWPEERGADAPPEQSDAR